MRQGCVVDSLLPDVFRRVLDSQSLRRFFRQLFDQELSDGVCRVGDAGCHRLKISALVAELLSFVAVVAFPQIPQLQFLERNLLATFQGNDGVRGFVGLLALFFGFGCLVALVCGLAGLLTIFAGLTRLARP